MSTNDAHYVKYAMYLSPERTSTYLPTSPLKLACKIFNQNHRIDQSKYLS